MSLTTSIARIANVIQPKFVFNSQSFKDYGKPWNSFWGLQFVNIHGGGGFLFRKLKVSAGRSGRWRSRNPLLCLFSFFVKRDFSILEIFINIYWVFSGYNWLLLVNLIWQPLSEKHHRKAFLYFLRNFCFGTEVRIVPAFTADGGVDFSRNQHILYN